MWLRIVLDAQQIILMVAFYGFCTSYLYDCV